MQVDPLPFHEEEGRTHDDRDTERQHDATPETEREEGRRHDDHDGLQERLCEIMDGLIHHLRLIRHEPDVHARRKVCLRPLDFPIEIVPERQVIPARLHRDRDTDRRFTIEIEKGRLRRRIGLRDLCHIAQMEAPLAHMDGDILQGFHTAEETIHADRHIARRCMDRPCRHHRRLLLQDAEYIRWIHPEGRELILIHLDVNILLLHAQELDLLHITDRGKTAAQHFRRLSLLFVRETIPRHRINRAIDIIEAVIHIRSVYTGGKRCLLIIHKISHLMPARLNIFLLDRVLQVHIDDRLAIMRERLQIVQPLRILELFLERIRHLLADSLRCRARPGRRHHRLTDGEVRILTAPQMEIRPQASQEDEENEEIDHRLVLDGPLCQIQPFHTRTSSPSASFETPAVTMRSPLASPSMISTVSSP